MCKYKVDNVPEYIVAGNPGDQYAQDRLWHCHYRQGEDGFGVQQGFACWGTDITMLPVFFLTL